MTFLKTPTTPENQALGVVDGIAKLAARLGLSQDELLRKTTRIVHGTTVATNALLERKGARIALLTTAGHRDVLEMREGLKLDRYDLRSPPPEPLVPRERRLPIAERLRADGSVSMPLEKASLIQAARKLKEEGVEGIAVCYFHAYRNDRHEKETFDYLRKELPNAYVSLSSEVLPQIKEYERVSTTVVNAYVGPGVRAYFADLERKLTKAGYTGTLYIILSHGGVAPIEEASRLAAATVLSGPAGGVAGCRHAALITGNLNLIPFDMGGTSTDISLIAAGEAALSSNRGLAGQRIALRSLDIISIGAGGGSIARAEGGALDVGPQSAGALPGPVCYGTKGTEPTVTDANVVLGRLAADRPLPGRTRARCACGEARAHPGAHRGGDRRGHQRQDGRWHKARDRVARRRPSRLRAFQLRRGCGASRLRPGARSRHLPHHRAEFRFRPLGLGHAVDATSLRGQPYAYWRYAWVGRERSQSPLRRARQSRDAQDHGENARRNPHPALGRDALR
jgi:N-methylhydantoinase A